MSVRHHFSGKFLAWCPGEGETEDDAEAIDAGPQLCRSRHAATRWLRLRNDEHRYSNAEELTVVHVRDPDGDVTPWDVRAEMTTTYSARRPE